MYNTYNTYLTYKGGFLRSMVVYLKDLSPYRRQFSPCSESQNTIGVNLLGNYSTSYYYVVDFVLTYIPSLLTEPTVVPATRFRYIYSLSKYLGLFIAKVFAGCYRSYRSIPIKGCLWLVSIEQLKQRYSYTVIRERELCVVYYRQQFQLVVLVVVNKGVKLLVKVLVYNLGLAVSLRVEYSRELNFNPKDTVEFVLEV